MKVEINSVDMVAKKKEVTDTQHTYVHLEELIMGTKS